VGKPPQFHQILSWTYTPSAGGTVHAVENTFHNGDPLKYAWVKVDDLEVDGDGKLKGDLDVKIRCIDPCYLEQLVSPLTITQIGGFGLVGSVGRFNGLSLNNCTGPSVLTYGPPSVDGFDLPFGAAIRVQTFGGFGVGRRWNASNRNLTGFKKPIVNRLTTEVSDSTNGYFVPWLKGLVNQQVAAGKKFIFTRKFGEGKHIFEFVADKVGPSLFSVQDEAGCIRYWAVNVVASHCWDWTDGGISVGNDGKARNSVSTDTKVTSLDEFADTLSRAEFLATKANILPQEMDADLVEKYYIQSNSSTDSFCDCTIGDAVKGNEGKLLETQKAEGIEGEVKDAPVLYKKDRVFIQTSRLFKGKEGEDEGSAYEALNHNIRTIVRDSRYLYVGETVEFNLPPSLCNSAATDEDVEMKGKVIRVPFVSDKWNSTDHKGEGYSADNTGPIAWTENDDRKIISASIPRRGSVVKIRAISPTNFLPAKIEIYHRGNTSLWAKGEKLYRYSAPPAPKKPVKIEISQADPDATDPDKPFVKSKKLGKSTNSSGTIESVTFDADDDDALETNYLKSVEYATDRISWTQSAVFVSVMAVCPPVDIRVESKPPWADEAEDGYEIYDYGEGAEFKFKVQFPLDFDGTVVGERFHIAEPEYAHPKNKFYGMDAPISSAKNGNWGNPDETGLTRNTSAGESDFSKSYVLNSSIGDKKHHNASSIAVFCSWRSGSDQLVYGKHPVYSYTRMGPGSVAGNGMSDDEWFRYKNEELKVYFGGDHTLSQDSKIKNSLKRNFGDLWRGVDEQLRGCNCMYRNVEPIYLKRQAPLIVKDGKMKELMIKDKDGIVQGIVFRGAEEEREA